MANAEQKREKPVCDYCGSDDVKANGRWYVEGGMYPIEQARAKTEYHFSFPSRADIARAYCEWLEHEAHR